MPVRPEGCRGWTLPQKGGGTSSASTRFFPTDVEITVCIDYDEAVGPPAPAVRRPVRDEWDDPTWISVEVDPDVWPIPTAKYETKDERR